MTTYEAIMLIFVAMTFVIALVGLMIKILDIFSQRK